MDINLKLTDEEVDWLYHAISTFRMVYDPYNCAVHNKLATAINKEKQFMKTVRVRIAVAINDKGEYCCAGYHNAQDRWLKDSALECLSGEGQEGLCFVEADVPLPQAITVEAGSVLPG